MNSLVKLKPRYWFALISLCYLGLAVAYSLITPPFQSIDEHSHFLYVGDIMMHWQIPVEEEGRALSPEQHQPPLYYLLSAGAAKVVNWCGIAKLVGVSQMTAAFYTGRWFSTLCGLATIIGSYRLSRLVFAERTSLALIATAVVAFNPSFISLTSAVTNDSLLFALSSFTMLGIIHIARRDKLSPRILVLAGIALGLTILTKLTALLFIIPLALAVTFTARRNRSWRRFFSSQSIAFGTAAAVGGWFYIRNLILYHDPVAWRLLGSINPSMIRPTPPPITDYPNYLMTESQTFWAAFGYVSNIRVPLPIYAILFGIMGLSALGLLLLIVKHLRKGLDLSSLPSVTYILLLFCIIINFVGILYFGRSYIGGWHGRHLFPNLGGISILMVTGLAFLVSTRRSAVLAVLPLGLLAVASFSLPVYMAPLNVTPDILGTEDVNVIGHRTNVIFDGGIQLIGYHIECDKVRPGDQIEAILYWKAIGDIRTDWTFFVHMVDTKENMVGEHNGRPLDGMYSTFFWRNGELWRGHYPITIDAAAHNGLYHLSVGMYDLQTMRHATVTHDGISLKRDSALLGDIKISSPQPRPVVQHPLMVEFQDNIRLLGWDWSRGKVTLYWEAVGKPAKSYTVFAHLLNDRGTVAAQHDSIPANGTFPTNIWDKGDYITDEHVIVADEGEYTLEVGLYDLKTMERLVTTDGDDRIVVDKVKVIK